MVSSIGNTNQVLIWPSIQISIFSTDYAIASIAWLTFTAIHGVTKVAKVIAFGILVAVMCSICAWITWLADLEDDINKMFSVGLISHSSLFPQRFKYTLTSQGKKAFFWSSTYMAFFWSSTPVSVLALIIFLVLTLCIIKWNQALRYLRHILLYHEWILIYSWITLKVMLNLWTLHGWGGQWYLKLILIFKSNG